MNANNDRMKTLSLLTALLFAGASRAAAAPWVAGYYTGWEQSQLPFSSVDLTAMDAVIDFAVVPTAVGTTDGGSANEMSLNMASRVAAVHAAGKKILYTVGGVGTQAAFEGSMSPSYQATFVGNLVTFMTANNYDGIDLDMEAMSAADAAPYVAFATALRAKMTAAKPGSLLTAAVTWDPAAFAQLNGIFDHIDLETYSLSGSWYNETWHNAPVYSAAAIGGGTLASVDSMVRQFEAAGVSAAKLGVGITFDPYVWTGGSGVTKPQQTWTGAPTVSETYYYAIAKTYGLVEGATTSVAGSVYGWDSSAQAAYLSVTGSPASNDAFISYDDVSAIDAKIAYAVAHGIGSVIVWDLAGGWRTDLPAGSRGRLLAAIKSAAYGGGAAPVISAVSVSGVTQTAATIAWTTDQAADTQVEYGLTAAYGATTPLNAALTANHSASLSGLSAGTLYHYAVMSRDAAGLLAASADSAFTTLVAVSTIPVLTGPFAETFSSYPLNTCIADGATFGPWTSAFSGYGCTQIKTDGVKYWLDESPFASASSSETHSSLVLGPSFAAPITFSANVYTNAQLRKNTPPNPWEVGWMFWDYTDNSHFYYFQAKPNGWELGKEDPAYPGSQRFLATGSSPVFPIDAWYSVKIVQTSNVITVYVGGQLVTTFTDTQTPYTTGQIGLYNEDSNVRFENVAVNVTPAAIGAVAAAGVGRSSATVSWTTNEIADTQVEYGLTAAYGSSTAYSAALTLAHSSVLSGLIGGALYHYAVLSRDIAGDLTTSADFTFVTISTAPPVISAVSASGVSQTAATIDWTTNEAAESQVEYGLSASYTSTTTLNAALATSHGVSLSGLIAGTLYHYAVLSVDAAGNLAVSPDSAFATLAAISTVPIMTTPFINNFSSSTLNACFADGAAFGPWTSVFGGFGCTSVRSGGARFWLEEIPAVSTAAALTHSALVLGPAFAAPIAFSVNVETAAQLRKNSAPNPWEVGWVIWDYTDNSRFYYFQAKPNGWELGKEDPASPGGQRFLATGSSPVFPIGGWYIVKIVQVLNDVSVYVNGRLITTFTDTLNPYTTGSIGLYSEDADVRFSNVAVNPPAGVAAPTVAVVVPATAASPAASAAIATLSGTTTVIAVTSNDADVVLVQFLLDGEPLGATLSGPPFSLSWNTSAYPPGAHTLSAIVWDAEGDSALSAGVPILLNAFVPAVADDLAKSPQKFLSPALADGINDVATFGPNAEEVSVYNIRGRLVFHGSQQGGMPIVWNCKDGSGRVDESGVYIAKIRKTDSTVIYQSLAIVK
jgi:GH18 family chitinase